MDGVWVRSLALSGGAGYRVVLQPGVYRGDGRYVPRRAGPGLRDNVGRLAPGDCGGFCGEVPVCPDPAGDRSVHDVRGVRFPAGYALRLALALPGGPDGPLRGRQHHVPGARALRSLPRPALADGPAGDGARGLLDLDDALRAEPGRLRGRPWGYTRDHQHLQLRVGGRSVLLRLSRLRNRPAAQSRLKQRCRIRR